MRFLLALLVWQCLAFASGSTVLAQTPVPAPVPVPVPAQTQPAEAWLVTYGPGATYWERFGHNAIWLREPARGLDHVFNFGFFDFEQENFLLRFVQGRMLYFSLALEREQDFAFYRDAGRAVRVQRLNLDGDQYQSLREHLLWAVEPANRDYRYDYYLDNCSTRVRDAIDLALQGELQTYYSARPGAQDFREHTRRSAESGYWFYLGLEFALGAPVDRAISQWDEMFLPEMLAVYLSGLPASLVVADQELTPQSVTPVAATARPLWPRYLALGLALVLAAAAIGRWKGRSASTGLALAWLYCMGLAGLLIAAAGAFTDHAVAAPNWNLLLANPLFLLAVRTRWRVLVALLAVLGLLASLLLNCLPWGQYSLDVLAVLALPNLAAAFQLWRKRSS